MQLILKLDVVDDGNLIECTEIWRYEDVGASLSPGHLGLSLSEGKTICAALQQAVAKHQVACLAATGMSCSRCGAVMRVKDDRRRRIDTAYGRIDAHIPRRFCVACGSKPAALTLPVTGRSTTEYDRLRAKLAAHLPYRVVGDILNACLPVAGGATHTTLRRCIAAVAERIEPTSAQMGAPPNAVPVAMTVALDTGYVRATPSAGSQSGWLINDSRRQRAGLRVSTSTADSAVNVVIDQRMNRRNRMRWSVGGAHHLLQVRTAVLNGTFDRSLENTMHGNTALARARLPMAKAA